MRVAIYVRVSGENDDRTASLDSQTEACQKWCTSRGIKDWEVYTENKSGFTLQRPALERLREGVRCGRFNRVLVYAVDRLAREQTHTFILLDEIVRHGCDLKSCTEEVENTAEGKFMLSVRAFMAEVEREKIRERTMRGKRKVFESGRLLRPSIMKYGFKFGEDGRYHIDEPNATVVRRIFQMAADGMSFRAILVRLTSEGIFGRNTGDWQAASIGQVVNCKHYKGEYVNSKGESYPFAFADDPIVDPDLWDKANLASNARERKRSLARNQLRFHLLRGVVFCGCGRRCYIMRGGPSKDFYYSCASREQPRLVKGVKQPPCTVRRNFKERVLNEEVWKAVLPVITTEERLRAAYDEATAAAPTEAPKDKLVAEIRKLEQNKKKVKASLLNMSLRGEFSEGVVEAMVAIEKRIADLKSQLPVATEKQTQFMPFAEAAAKFRELVPHGITDELKRELIVEMGVRVTTSIDGMTVAVFSEE